MKALLSILLISLFCATVADARIRDVTDPDAPRALPTEGGVSVSWTDPAQFTELRNSRNRWEAKRGDWVRTLAEYLQTRAEKRLPEGQRLDITITDIRRAGNYEPWRGVQLDSVRIMRDIYWPRIELSFRRLDASGNVIDEGERTLSDPMYMSNTSIARANDPLRYEKSMLDRWLQQEFSPPGA